MAYIEKEGKTYFKQMDERGVQIIFESVEEQNTRRAIRLKISIDDTANSAL